MAAHPSLVRFCTVTAVGLFLAGTGCCTKYKCGVPPTTIDIHDGAGERVATAQVAGAGFDILPCVAADDCAYSVRGEGVVTVSAPGYKSATVTVERSDDGCGNSVAQRIDVTLRPEGAAEQSTASTTLGDSCGR